MREERRRGRPPKNALACPRCGQPGYLESYASAGRKYLRVRHGSGKQRWFCYLGPVESYVYVDLLHYLGLTNLRDVDYGLVAEYALQRALLNLRLLRGKDAREAEARARELCSRLKPLLEELERLASAPEPPRF